MPEIRFMTARTDPIKRESANRFFSAPRVCWRCGDHKPRADCIRRAAERKSKEMTQ